MNKNNVCSDSANGIVESEIKFAGNDNKLKMYEPKHRRKLIRVLTVLAYVFSVSLAAIMLSLFYMFIYSPGKSTEFHNTEAQRMSYKEPLNMINNNYSRMEKEEPRVLPISQSDA